MKEVNYNSLVLCTNDEKNIYVGCELAKWMKKYKAPSNIRLPKKKLDSVNVIVESQDNSDNYKRLEGADWLIVVCSEEAKASPFCNDFLEKFIAIHGHNHVLAVLAKGEPDEAFLEKLFYRNVAKTLPNGETEIVIERVEPLAANFRGDTPKEIKNNMNAEFLKMMAPIFGVNFDDLKQRHKEQKNRKIATMLLMVSVLFVIVGIFSVFSVFKMKKQEKEIREQLEEIINNQSLSLAEESANALKKNDVDKAVTLALWSLTEYEGIELGYTSEGYRALFDSLYPYSVSGDFGKAVWDVEVNGIIAQTWTNEVMDYVVIYDQTHTLTIVDFNEKKITASISDVDIIINSIMDGTDKYQGCITEDNIFVYIDSDSIYAINCENGDAVSKVSLMDIVSSDQDAEKCRIYNYDNSVYVLAGNVLVKYDTRSGSFEQIYSAPYDVADIQLGFSNGYAAGLASINGYPGIICINLDNPVRNYHHSLDGIKCGDTGLLSGVCADGEDIYVQVNNYRDGGYYSSNVIKATIGKNDIELTWNTSMYEMGTGLMLEECDTKKFLVSLNNSTINRYRRGSESSTESHSAEGVLVENVLYGNDLYTLEGDKLIYHQEDKNEGLEGYYEKVSNYLELNDMEMNVNLSFVGNGRAVITEKNSNRVVLYADRELTDVTILEGYEQKEYDNKTLAGDEAKEYAARNDIDKDYLVEYIVFDEDDEYMLVSYINGVVSCFDADDCSLIDSFELKEYYNYREEVSFYEESESISYSALTKYYGTDNDDNDYYGSFDGRYGYILDEDHKFTGAVKNMTGYDAKNHMVILGDDIYIYGLDVLDYEGMLEIAEEYIND